MHRLQGDVALGASNSGHHTQCPASRTTRPQRHTRSRATLDKSDRLPSWPSSAAPRVQCQPRRPDVKRRSSAPLADAWSLPELPLQQAEHHRYNTQRIKLCSDWRQLAGVVSVHGPRFNAQNACAALVHLAQLGRSPRQPIPGEQASRAAMDAYAGYEALLQELLQLVAGSIPQLQARQVANVLWAAATLSSGYTGGHPVCLNLMMELLPVSATLLPYNNPQELSNSVWAVATAGLPVDDSWIVEFLLSAERALPQTTCRDLATMAWALARLGIQPDSEWLAAYTARVREAIPRGSHRDAGQILAAFAHINVNLASLDPQLLYLLEGKLLEESTVVVGRVGRGGRGQGQGGRGVGVEGRWSHSVSQGLWGMARMSAVPSTAWMQEVFAKVQSQLSQFNPQELSTTLWASVALGQAVPASLIQAIYTHTLTDAPVSSSLTKQLVPAFCPQSLAELAWALSCISQAQVRHSGSSLQPLAPSKEWLAAFYECVGSHLGSPACGEQPTAMILVALARLGVTPPADWAARVIVHINTNLTSITPRALTNCMWALATMGFQVQGEGLQALEQRLVGSLESEPVVSGSEIDGSEEGVGGGLSAEQWEGGDLQAGSGAWGSQELANMLWAFGTWRHRPSDRVTDLLLGRMRLLCARRAPVRPQELANTMWALARLGVQPSHGWLRDTWVACLQRMRSFNSKDVAQLVYALAKLGRQPPYVTKADVAAPARQLPQAEWSQGNLLAAGEDTQLPPPATAAAAGASQPAAAAAGGGTAPVLLDWSRVLLAEAAATLGKCNGQDMANVSWGLAQLGVKPEQAWLERFARELTTRGSVFGGGHLATCVWALGSMGFRPAPQSLLPLEGKLFRCMPSLAPRELAACVCGFSTMSYQPDPEWLEAFAAQCKVLASDFTYQDWQVVVYSLSSIVKLDKTAEMYLEDLFLSPQLLGSLHKFGPSGVAILLYAASVLGAQSPRLVGRLLEAAKSHMSHFSGRELAALITSCVRTGVPPDRPFLLAWMREFTLRMRRQVAEPGPEPARAKAVGFGSPAAGAQPLDTQTVPALSSTEDWIDTQGSVSKAEGLSQGSAEAAEHTAALQQALDLSQAADDVAADTQAASAEPAVGRADAEGKRLAPSVLAVCGWALAKLGLRPKQDWLTGYQALMLRHALAGELSPRETQMALLALATWECVITFKLLNALKALVKQHKPVYTLAERQSIKLALRILHNQRYTEAPLKNPKAPTRKAMALAVPVKR